MSAAASPLSGSVGFGYRSSCGRNTSKTLTSSAKRLSSHLSVMLCGDLSTMSIHELAPVPKRMSGELSQVAEQGAVPATSEQGLILTRQRQVSKTEHKQIAAVGDTPNSGLHV
jgi:hypothetical protein